MQSKHSFMDVTIRQNLCCDKDTNSAIPLYLLRRPKSDKKFCSVNSQVLYGLVPLINMQKMYIFEHFVKAVKATYLKFGTIVKLVTLHREQTNAQVNMQIDPMRMRKPLFCLLTKWQQFLQGVQK